MKRTNSRLLLLALLLALPSLGAAQKRSFTGLSLGLGGAMAYWNYDATPSLTLGAQLGLRSFFGYERYNSSAGDHSTFYLGVTPYVGLGSYFFYSRGNNSLMSSVNTGQYIGLNAGYWMRPWIITPKDWSSSSAVSASAFWGQRQQISERLLLDYQLGLGLEQNLEGSKKLRIYPVVSLGINYLF